MAQVFQRDENGTVIDPPTNPTYEQFLTSARDSGDDAEVQRVQGAYDEWRAMEVERIEAQADQVTTTTATPGAEPTPVDHPAQMTPEQRAALRAELDAADNAAGNAAPDAPGAGTPPTTVPGGGAA